MAGTVVASASGLVPTAQAGASGACPAVGGDTSCGVLIVINASGTISVTSDGSQLPFDGSEDTLVGVVNNSNQTILSLPLSGPGIFGFDGDGLCTPAIHPASCPIPGAVSGYEGPNTTFTITDAGNGAVNFTGGGLPATNGFAYFALEGNSITTSLVVDPAIQATNVTPFAVEATHSFTSTVATFSDPDTSAAAAEYTATINWGDGSAVDTGTVTGPTGGQFAVSGTHTYATVGPFSATVTITDADNAANTANTTTSITSQDSLIAAQNTPALTEEVTHSFTANVASFTDPDTSATAADYTATIDWGDSGTSAGTITLTSGVFAVSGTHTYATVGPFSAKVTITDADNPANTATVTTSIASQDQAVAAHGAAAVSIQKGTAFNGQVASFTDADTSATAADYTATINWGDSMASGGTITGPTGGPFTVTGSHTYTSTTATNIQVTIADADNPANTGTATTPVTVYDVVAPCSGACTATDSGSGVTATVTTSSTTSGTINLVIGGTLSCGDSFFHLPAEVTITTSNVTTKLPKLMVLSIAKQFVQSHDPSKYAVCYHSPTAFRDVNGTQTKTGLLPSCLKTFFTPPCVVLKTPTFSGAFAEILILPNADPNMR